MNWLRRNPIALIGGGLVALALAAFLAFGVFGVQTLFTDDVVSEDNPFAASDGESGFESDATSTELADDMNEAMEDVEAEVIVEEKMPEMPDAPEVVTVATGGFEGRAHPSSGIANFITDGSETFLRFEDDFVTDNGPDLNVYLSKAPIGAESGEFDDDFIDLGDLKGNIGSQNYQIGDDVDLGDYQTVVIWCVRFGVAFGAAPIDFS
ncbi:MAG: DM13 domain-containing protein [Acidimicrobiales bacterium]